ncbi:hypothetical protein BD408DRAFT_407713, partial [Parasitella parasitica]
MVDPATLDPRYLVSDICFLWQPDLGIVEGVIRHLAWPTKVLRVYLDINKNLGPVSLVFPAVMDSKIVLCHADYHTVPRSDGASF